MVCCIAIECRGLESRLSSLQSEFSEAIASYDRRVRATATHNQTQTALLTAQFQALQARSEEQDAKMRLVKDSLKDLNISHATYYYYCTALLLTPFCVVFHFAFLCCAVLCCGVLWCVM